MTEKQIIKQLRRAHKELDNAKALIIQGLKETKSVTRKTKRSK